MEIDRNRFRTGGRQKVDWSDWLSNDPPPASVNQELRRKRVAAANQYQPRAAQPMTVKPPVASAEAPPNVTININVPKFNLPKIKIKKLPRLSLPAINYRRLGVSLVALLFIASGVWFGFGKIHNHSTASSDKAVDYVSDRTTPSFTPVAPKDEPQLAKFSPNVTHYDGHHDTYSYSDLLPGGHITVSEQSMPTKFGQGSQGLAALAVSMGATQPIVTNKGTAYINTDPKSGSQVIVFSLNGLLILINSPYGHSSGTWKSYIENLQ